VALSREKPMKKLGLALASFGIFTAMCDGLGENPSGPSSFGSHHWSKSYGFTTQLHPPNPASPISYRERSTLNKTELRELVALLATQPIDNLDPQSGTREFLVGTWVALAILADWLTVRSHCAASVDNGCERKY
jgi:hypothetical protein